MEWRPNEKPLYSRAMRALGAIAAPLCLAVSLAGCATTPMTDSPAWMSLLREALTVPAAELERKAVAGDARAQFSIGLVYQYALQGQPADPLKAAEYKRRAVASRGSITLTQYIPGINGNPGRTALISVPKYGVDQYEGRLTEACAAAVAAKAEADQGARACGNLSVYLEMSLLWPGRGG
ncbi:MAG: hypothetical protein QM667_04960 [Asticcacaulis sp.]